MVEYSVETIIDHIQKACAKNGVSANKMGIESGAGKSAMDNIKKGSMPACDKIAKMADYLHCSVDYLLGREELMRTELTTQDDLNSSERQLIELYRELTDSQKQLVVERARTLCDLNEAEAKKDSAV